MVQNLRDGFSPGFTRYHCTISYVFRVLRTYDFVPTQVLVNVPSCVLNQVCTYISGLKVSRGVTSAAILFLTCRNDSPLKYFRGSTVCMNTYVLGYMTTQIPSKLFRAHVMRQCIRIP